MVYYGYQKTQARRPVQLYYALLVTADKDRLYKEFKKPNLEIHILVSFNTLIYGANIPNIKHFIQFCMPKNKDVNMMWQ